MNLKKVWQQNNLLNYSGKRFFKLNVWHYKEKTRLFTKSLVFDYEDYSAVSAVSK